MLFAAAVHDFEHTGRGIKLVHPKSLAPSSTYRWLERPYSVLSLKGTTNNFHVQTKSRLAMIYNDRSVLENHHLSVAFRLLQNPDIDILDGLSSDEFKVPLVLWPIQYSPYIGGIFIHYFIGISDIGNWYGASNRHVIAFSTNQGKHQSNNMHFVARIVDHRITFPNHIFLLMLDRKWKSRVQHQIHLIEDLRWDSLFMQLISHIRQKFGICIRDGLMTLLNNSLDRFAI